MNARALELAALIAAPLLVFAAPARADSEWVDRGLTMRSLGLSFDVGVGVASTAGPYGDAGAGMNLEAAFGVLDDLEVGLRTGLRMGDGAKTTQADDQGRLFDPETYGAGEDLFANPELRVLGRLFDLSIVELGLEGRLEIPAATGTRASFLVGAPIRLHFGRSVRVDTGVYVPVVLYDAGLATGTVASFNVPLAAWFQATRALFLGPIAEVRANNDDPALGVDHGAGLLLGFGLGVRLSPFADLKAAFDFPRINADPGPDFGFGLGLGLHFDGQ